MRNKQLRHTERQGDARKTLAILNATKRFRISKIQTVMAETQKMILKLLFHLKGEY